MAILDSKESLILGDIAVTPSLSRSKAESALDWCFYFDNKSSEESSEYHDCVRVMFLYANIYDKPGRDVLYSFVDYSLFQKYDGSFFLAAQHCEPFGGGQTLKNEFDKDFFKNTSKDEVLEIFNQSLISRISPSKDFNLLFENRKFSFYAEQRYLCFDYRVLFYHSELTPEKLKEDYEEEISHAEKCIDSEIIKAHLTAEYEKALAALKEKTWKEIEWEDYRKLMRQEIIDYKINRHKERNLVKQPTRTSSSKKIKEKIDIPPFIKQSLIASLCFFIFFSILEFIATQDFDFFIEFLGLEIIGSIIFGFVYTLKYGKKSESKFNWTNYSSTTSTTSKFEKEPELILADDNTELKFNLEINPFDFISKLDSKLFDPFYSGLVLSINQKSANRGDEIRFEVCCASTSNIINREKYKDAFLLTQPEWGGCIGAPLNFKLEELLREILGKGKDIYYGTWIEKDPELVKKAILGVLNFALHDYDFYITLYIPKEEIKQLDFIEELKSDAEKINSEKIYLHYEKFVPITSPIK